MSLLVLAPAATFECHGHQGGGGGHAQGGGAHGRGGGGHAQGAGAQGGGCSGAGAAGAGPWTTTEGIKGAASAAAKRYWASLKSQARAAGEYTTHKARAAGEYATLRTRQGVALFGEPNIGPIKTIVDRY
ncbi:uncharacterized PE-PGRS family protein PE_PGRS20-like [Triticum aestivum]|uniref:uncharacterized PE-PGRS family protein PE_PGRS20-like n=1 Tax=Triticum aestivum TaxID=4565 RepID=UPI001D0351E2|nr:uncharacterized PE-PGRS family protein PE_PGRS20-like [Triticum aestivum]